MVVKDWSVLLPQPGPEVLLLIVQMVPGFIGDYLRTSAGSNPLVTSGRQGALYQPVWWRALGEMVAYSLAPLTFAVYVVWPHWFNWLQFAPRYGLTTVIGILVVVGGVTLTSWARITLAGNWSGSANVRERHQLVTYGPYHWVRHPMYTGFVATGLGFTLATMHVIPFVCLTLEPMLLARRAWAEERVLYERFGADYQAYRVFTGMFLPRLRR